MLFPSTINIELSHTKDMIYGFGFYSIEQIFWWFGDKSYILYHYRYPREQILTAYLKLDEHVTKHSHQLIGYNETSNSLILKEI